MSRDSTIAKHEGLLLLQACLLTVAAQAAPGQLDLLGSKSLHDLGIFHRVIYRGRAVLH